MPKKLTPEKVIEQLSEFIFTINAELDDDEACVHNLDYIFESNGWKLLSAQGHFSRVYESPCEQYALKVNTINDIYPLYAYWSIAHPENPYLPNIYWHVSIDNYVFSWIKSVTLIEKLERLSIDKLFAHEEISDLYIKSNESYEDCLRNILDNRLQVKDKLLDSVLIFIKQIPSELRFELDFEKVHNYMLRGNQIVITDPINTIDGIIL
jgi:hypothetical protein